MGAVEESEWGDLGDLRWRVDFGADMIDEFACVRACVRMCIFMAWQAFWQRAFFWRCGRWTVEGVIGDDFFERGKPTKPEP